MGATIATVLNLVEGESMLKPDKSDPNYDEQMKQFQKDNSSWGIDHTKLDMMKRRGAQQQQPPQPERR